MGCEDLNDQVRSIRLRNRVHVYGHSSRHFSQFEDGILYVNHFHGTEGGQAERSPLFLVHDGKAIVVNEAHYKSDFAERVGRIKSVGRTEQLSQHAMIGVDPDAAEVRCSSVNDVTACSCDTKPQQCSSWPGVSDAGPLLESAMEQYVRVADARAWMKHNEAFPAFPSPPSSSRLQRSSRSPKRPQCGKLRCEPVGPMLPDLPESEELIKPHRSAKLKLLEGGEEDAESDASLLPKAECLVASTKELPKNPFASVAAVLALGHANACTILCSSLPTRLSPPGPVSASSADGGGGAPDSPQAGRPPCNSGARGHFARPPNFVSRETQTPSSKDTSLMAGATAKADHLLFTSHAALCGYQEPSRGMPRPPAVVATTWKWPGSVAVPTGPVAQLVSPPLQSRSLAESTDDAPSAVARASLVAAFLSPPFAYRNTLADLSTRVQRASPAVEVGAYSWQPGMGHGIAETVKLADEPVRDPFSTAREKEVLGSPLVTRARAPSALASPPSGTLRCRATLGSQIARQRNAGSLPSLSRSSISSSCNEAHVKESAADTVRVRIQPPKYWVQAAPVILDASEQSLRWSQKLAPGRRSRCWIAGVKEALVSLSFTRPPAGGFFVLDGLKLLPLREGGEGGVALSPLGRERPEVMKEKDSQKLKMCKTVPKATVRTATNVMEKLSTLQDLQHPHISSITDLMEDDKNYYIISDYYMGGDVQDWLEKMDEGNWLQESTCAAYVRQALLALCHSHSAQVFHRDLKPSNLLLTTKLPDAVIKVVDFGLANILDPDNAIIQKHPNEYTVPEILKNSEPIKHGGADMWSVGAIAHALLVGSGASVSSRRSWGFSRDDEGWSERSPMARDFVLRLLRPAGERPTAAKALHHPWLKGIMPISSINTNHSNTKEARELRYKMLCYSLSLILLPAVVPHRDFDQLRTAFQQSDLDRDGFIPKAIGLRLLLGRCNLKEAVVPAMNIVDLGRTDTCDLASVAAADLIAREFFAAGPTSAPLVGPFGATDLAPRLIKRFFEVFADKQNGSPVAAVHLGAIRTKTRTATARDVEAFAGINYEELLTCLPEDTMIDSQLLMTQLSASAGRGTPLGIDQELSPLRAESPWESAFLDFFGIFYTCSASKRDESPGSIRMY
eukprot:s790_g17.t1